MKTKKTAIMQPYIFPYIGYWQLINAVDTFVILDDVNFIKRGWINRNHLLMNGKSTLFSFPLVAASQNKKIFEINLQDENQWKQKFLKTIKNTYAKAPYFKEVFALIEGIIIQKEVNLSKFITYQLKEIATYLKIDTEIKNAYNTYQNEELKGESRILDICKKEYTSIYMNPIGGQELYHKNLFFKNKIELYFLQSGNIKYPQFKNDFVPWLSIIDVMMFNSIEEIKVKLLDYKLV